MATITKRRTADGRVHYSRSDSGGSSSGGSSSLGGYSFDDLVRLYDVQSGTTDRTREDVQDFESGMQSERLNQALDISRMEIGSNEKLTQAKIDAELKMAKDEIDFKYAEMEKIGVPTLELEKWYREQQIRLADLAHQLDVRRLEEEVRARHEQLGLDYLKTAASLSGPENYFQQSAFYRGANDLGSGNFVDALMSGVQQAPYQQVGSTAPIPLTAGGILAQLGAGTFRQGTPTTSSGQVPSGPTVEYRMVKGGVDGWYDTATGQLVKASGTSVGSAPSGYNVYNPERSGADVGATSANVPADQIPQAGTIGALSPAQNEQLFGLTTILDAGHRLSPGAVEGMSEEEMGLLESAAKFSGRSLPTFLKNYAQSQTVQGSALAA